MHIIVAALILHTGFATAIQTFMNYSGPDTVTKVAVIGAGAGGSSAAYYLQKFTSHGYNITIFEDNGYIGGRSTTIKNYDPNYPFDIELGGSVFVDANKILFNAAKEFNLTTKRDNLRSQYPKLFHGTIGVWDGTDFVFTQSASDSGLFNKAKLFLKYKLSPLRTYFLVKNFIQDFLNGFYDKYFPFELDYAAGHTQLGPVANVTGASFLESHHVSSPFAKEIIEAATRMNYRSNVDDIHAVETLVSLAADDTYQVEGGNYLIFENFIARSGANLLLNCVAQSISSIETGWNVEYSQGGSDTQSDTFDQVIIAAPFHLSNITLKGDNIEGIDEVPYRTLHATYVSTSRTTPINNPYFGNGSIPEMILTKSSLVDVPFFSISIVSYDPRNDTIIYKLFTASPVDEKFLLRYLFDNETPFQIVYSKVWKPYPHLVSRQSFGNFQIGQGLWYLNNFEPLISTMETSCLAGASVAGLMSIGRNTTAIKVP
ncbi:LADA_0H15500g1_1 [Lachancea dasiensis]|uniref:LADA_0H15500g1_1 n=1 Tax=Lachancea dasiensis TaxID=1072105 RepID=A0A1G4K548_9SACH|nr:LADA_0H15500g1_1 [Lachancea dasiensis]